MGQPLYPIFLAAPVMSRDLDYKMIGIKGFVTDLRPWQGISGMTNRFIYNIPHLHLPVSNKTLRPAVDLGAAGD